MSNQLNAGCPCGRTGTFGMRSFEECCGPYLAGERPAPDPESLMRSRYTAFALGRADYLRDTWDVSTRPAAVDLDASLSWIRLEVLSSSVDGDRGQVEFVAHFQMADGLTEAGSGPSGKTVGRHQERSRFVRRQGAWFYLDDQGD